MEFDSSNQGVRMIDINISVVYQLINFLLLVFLLNLVLYKPVRAVLAKRQATKTSLSDAAESSTHASEETVAAIADKLKEGHALGRERYQALLNSAKEVEKEDVVRMRQKVETEIAAAMDSLAGEKKEVLSVLDGQVEELARRIGVQIVGRELG